MRNIVRLVMATLMLTLGFVALMPADANAQSYGRNRVFHSQFSERASIATATEYNGKGFNSQVKRGHRLPEGAGKIKSVLVPKGCTLLVNNRAIDTAWTHSKWANIGKANFMVVTMKMDCGRVKIWTT